MHAVDCTLLNMAELRIWLAGDWLNIIHRRLRYLCWLLPLLRNRSSITDHNPHPCRKNTLSVIWNSHLSQARCHHRWYSRTTNRAFIDKFSIPSRMCHRWGRQRCCPPFVGFVRAVTDMSSVDGGGRSVAGGMVEASEEMSEVREWSVGTLDLVKWGWKFATLTSLPKCASTLGWHNNFVKDLGCNRSQLNLDKV